MVQASRRMNIANGGGAAKLASPAGLTTPRNCALSFAKSWIRPYENWTLPQT